MGYVGVIKIIPLIVSASSKIIILSNLEKAWKTFILEHTRKYIRASNIPAIQLLWSQILTLKLAIFEEISINEHDNERR